MIFKLVKLDMAWKLMPAFTLLFTVFSFLMAPGISKYIQPDDGALFATFSASMVILLMFIGEVDVRTTQFLSTLPITSRQLLLSRAASMMALLWAPSISCALVFALIGRQGIKSATYLIGMSSFATLLITIMHLIRIKELIVPANARFLLAAIFIWFVIGLALPILPVAILCLAISALLFAKIVNSVPHTYQVASRVLNSSKRIEENAPIKTAVKPGTMSFGALKPVLKSIYPWFYLFSLPIMAVQFFSSIDFMLPMFVVAMYSLTRPKTRWMWTLPLSSTTLYNLFLLPILFITLAASVAVVHIPRDGKQIYFTSTQNWPFIPFVDDDGAKPNVIPPIELWKPASGIMAPAIIAPWGEAFRPPIVIFQGYRIFNPYAVGKENSDRFFKWQCSRAMTAAHGKSFSLKDYARARRPFVPEPRIQLINIASKLLLILLWLCSIEAFEWRGFTARASSAGVVAGSIFIFACYTTMAWASFPVHNSRMEFFLVRLSWILPENPYLTLTILVIPLALAYWAAIKMSRESEFLIHRLEMKK